MQAVYARELAAAKLSPQKRKLYEIGMMLTDANQKEYRPPKHIRDWVKQKGEGMLRGPGKRPGGLYPGDAEAAEEYDAQKRDLRPVQSPVGRRRGDCEDRSG